MNVGMTFDLREAYLAEGYGEEETAEFDRPSTVDAIERALLDLGYQVDRIGHARNLITRLAAGERWDIVFNFAEGLKGFGREAQVPSILDIYGIPYTFSDGLVLALTLHKGMTQRVIRQMGIPTPDFAVVESEADADKVDLPFPLFAKPVAEGTGKGITAASKIRSKADLKDICKRLIETFQQPVLVETFMPGREFTVGIIGTGDEAVAVAAMEVILRPSAEQDVYSYKNKEECEELVDYELANDTAGLRAKEVALAAWRGLGCRDAGRVDLRADAQGAPRFLEVNPLAGLHPEHSDLPILCSKAGITHLELIDRTMKSALKRVGRRTQA
jgi:D-alanine-D-alanine ligase